MIKNIDGIDVEMTADEIATFEASRAVTPSLVDYQNAIQSFIDKIAQSKQFNDGITIVSYKDSTNDLWSQQATTFIAWRDNVWTYVYSQLQLVQNFSRSQPSVDDFINELPKINWPDGA